MTRVSREQHQVYLPLASLKPANVEETGRLLTRISVALQLIYQLKTMAGTKQSQKYASKPWVYERLHSVTRRSQ